RGNPRSRSRALTDGVRAGRMGGRRRGELVCFGGPIATRGQRVGLLGGSFDPPHAGHLHVTLWALRALGLDRVWWLVSPGNPLKPRGPAAMGQRIAAARRVV